MHKLASFTGCVFGEVFAVASVLTAFITERVTQGLLEVDRKYVRAKGVTRGQGFPGGLQGAFI